MEIKDLLPIPLLVVYIEDTNSDYGYFGVVIKSAATDHVWLTNITTKQEHCVPITQIRRFDYLHDALSLHERQRTRLLKGIRVKLDCGQTGTLEDIRRITPYDEHQIFLILDSGGHYQTSLSSLQEFIGHENVNS